MSEDFKIYAPIWAFEKADAPEGQRRRIGGLITTDARDRQGEVVLQEGLDFSGFVKDGWFNDNHMKGNEGVVGVPDPDSLKFFRKGDKLPNGAAAPSNGHWAEGWLLEGDPRADTIWSKIRALQKIPARRGFGFSIEGKIKRRGGSGMKTIAKADVAHVAVTHCPVNTETYLEALAKSLIAAQDDEDKREDANEAASSAEKALTMGAPSSTKPTGPRTGEGAGRVLAPQSLDRDELHREGVVKSEISVDKAIAIVKSRYPNISCATAGRIVDLTLALKRRGQGGQHG